MRLKYTRSHTSCGLVYVGCSARNASHRSRDMNAMPKVMCVERFPLVFVAHASSSFGSFVILTLVGGHDPYGGLYRGYQKLGPAGSHIIIFSPMMPWESWVRGTS